MAKAGNLPDSVEAIRFRTGTIRIVEKAGPPSQKGTERAVIYARINTKSEEADLQEQLRACRAFCEGRGWEVDQVIHERAPGFGPKRHRLHSILTAPPPRLVVARPSVLSRFDLSVTEILLRNLGCQLCIVNRDETLSASGGALEDLTDAISSTCHLHYGVKRGRALVEDLNRLITRRTS
jgi:predicted site-specific integrase-resolvase